MLTFHFAKYLATTTKYFKKTYKKPVQFSKYLKILDMTNCFPYAKIYHTSHKNASTHLKI